MSAARLGLSRVERASVCFGAGVGVFLLFAAASKAADPDTWPNSWAPFALDMRVSALIITLEVALGVWLISGWRPVLSQGTAVICFSIFVALNLRKALDGWNSCGCLGRIDVNPWAMAGIDSLLLCGLMLLFPTTGTAIEEISPMSRKYLRLLPLVGFVLLPVSGMMLYLRRPANSGSLTVDPPIKEFGEVSQGRMLTHRFKLFNSGDKPIRIDRILPGCSCAIAEDIAGKVISPGGVCEVSVSLNTGVVEGRRGSRIKVYYLTPGSELMSLLTFDIRSTVESDYWVRPICSDFGISDGRVPTSRTIEVRPNRKADLQILRVDVSDVAFSAKTVPAPPGSIDRRIELQFSPGIDATPGRISASVKIITDSPNLPAMDLLATVDYRPPVSCLQRAVVVSGSAKGPVERGLEFRSEQPIRILGVSSPDARVSVTYANDTGPVLHAVVRLDQDSTKGLNTSLTIQFERQMANGVKEVHALAIPVHRLPVFRSDLQ